MYVQSHARQCYRCGVPQPREVVMAQPLLAGQFTGKRRPGVLPIEPNSFIGRAAESQRLTALLRAARLVTVVGPGGVGKSRLCLHIASGALTGGRFTDGVVLVELSG